jgi:hypothetical protein
MFVAKPFIGFSLANTDSTIESHSLLTKSFSKRKPEDLDDAKAKASSIQEQIINPPFPLLLSIASLLAFLFPLIFVRDFFSGSSFLNSLKVALIPAAQPYLLAGKLTI